MIKLFVYGLLIGRYKKAIPATLEGYAVNNFGHATIVERAGSITKGELVEVTPAELERIDEIEGFPEYYTRFKVLVQTQKGVEEAWVYQMQRIHWR
jgi:gamma-glutamylcyclotransferase (GGCT)/AIG2-like uncharacterized protein YtfP